MTGWRSMDSAPTDGSWVYIRGEDFPHRPGHFLVFKAQYARVETTHPFRGFMFSWRTEDGKYGWHAHQWRPDDHTPRKGRT